MARAKLKLYPYVRLDGKGELQYIGAAGWKTEDQVDAVSGSMTVSLPQIEVEVEYPDPEQLRAGALNSVQEFKRKKQAEHVLLMNAIMYLENSLLRLEAPEILDAEPTTHVRPGGVNSDYPDDIPF